MLPYPPGTPITPAELIGLASRARQVLEGELDGSLVATLPSTGTLAVASDIHGDAEALERILDISGALRGEAHLLMMGDYGDKGRDSVAVVSSLLALKAERPWAFTLLRGNHETSFPGSWLMSFRRELRRRYGIRDAARVWSALIFAFEAFPIVAVADNGLVAMHGGPPRSLTLAGMTHAVLHDVLWSDMHRGPRASRRGGPLRLGKGRKVAAHEVEHFLANAEKAILLRGHSHTMRGAEALRGNVLTLISANSLHRISGLLGRRVQRGMAEIDLSANLTDVSQVSVRFF